MRVRGMQAGDYHLERPANARWAEYIAVRYTRKVVAQIRTEEYRALAELRYRIRHFLRAGDAVARAAGLEPQQYLVLLTIRGLPEGEAATIRTLAERLALKHHSAVELVDRLEANGYVHRSRGRDDRRRVLVSLLPRGERILEDVARRRIHELRSYGRELARAIEQLLQRSGKARGGNHVQTDARKRTRGKRA
jgi:DNA-binding MarR family transcriptional regulator